MFRRMERNLKIKGAFMLMIFVGSTFPKRSINDFLFFIWFLLMILLVSAELLSRSDLWDKRLALKLNIAALLFFISYIIVVIEIVKDL
jgi:hypothetical protein